MRLGYLSAAIYVLITVISTLFIESKLSKVGDARDVLFLAMVVTSIFFNLSGIKIIKKTYADIKSDIYGYLKFCTLIGLIWCCTVYGVQNCNAFLFNLFFFMTSAGIAYFVNYKNGGKSLHFILFTIVILILVATFIYDFYYYIGIIISTIGGVCAYFYRKSSFIYSRKHTASALEILMTRFIPISLVLGFTVNYDTVSYIVINHYWEVIVFSLISFIIPTYLGQYATNQIGAEHSAIISALIFPICWFGEIILHSKFIMISYFDLIIACCAAVVIVIPYAYNWRIKLQAK